MTDKILVDRSTIQQVSDWFKWFHAGNSLEAVWSSKQCSTALRAALDQPALVQQPAVLPGYKPIPAELLTDAIAALDDYAAGIEFGSYDRKTRGKLKALLNAAPEAPEQGQCGLCGADQPFTGSCGGGRENPLALCFAAPAVQRESKAETALNAEVTGGPLAARPVD